MKTFNERDIHKEVLNRIINSGGTEKIIEIPDEISSHVIVADHTGATEFVPKIEKPWWTFASGVSAPKVFSEIDVEKVCDDVIAEVVRVAAKTIEEADVLLTSWELRKQDILRKAMYGEEE